MSSVTQKISSYKPWLHENFLKEVLRPHTELSP